MFIFVQIKIVLLWVTRSACALRDRLAQKGESTEEDIPEDSKRIDWNDILCRQGERAFPLIKP